MISSDRLQQRSRLLQAVRSFFYTKNYLEADTPIRLPVLIPEPHILPFASEGWYLHTSPEICMKRLLARGNARLFQISHCFRKEEVGRLHQSEFTMLEWYHAGWSYVDLMRECEELVQYVVHEIPYMNGITGESMLRAGRTIPLTSPWEYVTVNEAFEKFADITAREAIEKDMFDELLVTKVEPKLGWEKPTFLYDYPVELGSLARSKKSDSTVAERFELYIAGIELVNGFSELIEPYEQKKRFERDCEIIKQKGREAGMPEKFLADLANMDETAGAALGFDRLFMLLSGAESITEVICLNPEDL